MHWFARLPLVCFVSLIAVGSLHAQRGQAPPNAQPFEHEGLIRGMAPGGIQMALDNNTLWLVQVLPRQTNVKITGTAEPGFLHPGLLVKFSGTIDDKGVLSEELGQLEIYTPTGKNSMGAFPAGADENARPVGKLTEGTYDFRGKVLVFRDGELTVVAGKKITGKVASDAKISVNVSDLRFAQMEDPIKVRGWERSQPVGMQQPGVVVASDVEITLSKPLAALPQKGKGRSARTGKHKRPEEPAVNAEDPFNVGGK